MANEIKFQQFLRTYQVKKFDVLNFEYILYSIGSVISQKRLTDDHIIGRIDVIFRYKRTKYIGEIKWRNLKNGDFWDACKVLAYTEYFKWQTDDHSVKPAVLIPADSVRLEHQMIAGKLGITIFVVNQLEDRYEIKPLTSEPYWKQLQIN